MNNKDTIIEALTMQLRLEREGNLALAKRIDELRQAIEQAEKQEPVAFVPGFYCGEKISLSRVKAGQRFVLVRTGQVYSKTKDGYWNEAEQRLARLHLNCQVQIIEDKPAVKTYAGGKPNYCTPVDAVNISQERVDEKAKREHEPVAWMYVNTDGECEQIEHGEPLDDPSVTPLYTAPPKREWVGLTDEQVEDEWERITGHSIFGGDRSEGRAMYISPDEVIEFARVIEAKLKEKNGG